LRQQRRCSEATPRLRQGTTIEKIKDEESGSAIYDLSGRCIDNSKFKIQNSKLPNGVYIHKGKKFVISPK
jgi:hypothetical protein